MALKIAVITPYYKEPLSVLMKCHESVMTQTYPCDHFMIADGFPRDEFDDRSRTIHVKLPAPNSDNGNTPRGIGGILAESQGYDAVAFLDADNWFDLKHIENLVGVHLTTKSPIISCRRKYYSLDGEFLPIFEPNEDRGGHVDTSCWLIFRPCFQLLKTWFMPKILSPICDRIFFEKVKFKKYNLVMTEFRSVAFRSQYVVHYKAANRPLIDGLKTSQVFFESLRYLNSPQNVPQIIEALGFYPIIDVS